MFTRHGAQRYTSEQILAAEQLMLAIGRVLVTNPKLLIMDEPSEGLAPTVVETLIETIRDLAASGMGLFVVEQDLGGAVGDPGAQKRYLGAEPLPDAKR